MKAYHNSEEVKQKYVNRMKAHIEADELIRGVGFEDGKGCAVGCTLDNYSHKAYEEELQVPKWLARVKDTIFEGMSLEKSQTWPLIFLESVKVGSDLEKIKRPFLIFICESVLDKFDHKKFPHVKTCVDTVIDLLKNENPHAQDYAAAARAARAAAAYDDAAARAAYDAAAAAAAARAAYAYAADAYAARAAAAAAARAAYDAAAARAAYAADTYAARAAAAAYDKFADKLIELIRECK